MKSPLDEMKKKIRKAEMQYKEKYGNTYCLFVGEHEGTYQIAQHQLWHLKTDRFDSIVFNEIVMVLGTRSFFDACDKAYDAGYRGVINSDVERMRNDLNGYLCN